MGTPFDDYLEKIGAAGGAELAGQVDSALKAVRPFAGLAPEQFDRLKQAKNVLSLSSWGNKPLAEYPFIGDMLTAAKGRIKDLQPVPLTPWTSAARQGVSDWLEAAGGKTLEDAPWVGSKVKGARESVESGIASELDKNKGAIDLARAGGGLIGGLGSVFKGLLPKLPGLIDQMNGGQVVGRSLPGSSIKPPPAAANNKNADGFDGLLGSLLL